MRARRTSPAGWLAQIAAGGLLAACLLVVATLPFGKAGAAGLALVLALPLTVAAVALLRALGDACARSARLRPLLLRAGDGPVQAALGVGGIVTVAGVYAANRFLTDEALGPITRVGYLITSAAALATACTVHLVARRPSIRRKWARVPAWLPSAVTFALAGAIAPTVDAAVIPLGHPVLHAACLAVAVIGFGGLGALLTRHLRVAPLGIVAVVGAALLAAPGPFQRQSLALLAAQPPGTFYFQLVTAARAFFDSDGDGYSRVLGGGDCDDDDPRTYPLSTVGRDCLGWIPAEISPQSVPPRAEGTPGVAPRVVILVTIDAFRCGFGRFDRAELRDICPALTALAGEGRARLDAHTSGPNTEIAMAGLHHGLDEGGPSLGELLRARGYRTHAIVTHRVLLRDDRVRRSLDSVDDTLIPESRKPNGSTAAAVTDRVLAWLAAVDRTPDPAFLWVHYYDTHAPYARTPGALFITNELESYRAEVLRTDAEIGRLASGIRGLARAGEVLMMITADHGEAFGEHGVRHHVSTMHEETLRVPFVVWAPRDAGRFVRGEVPVTLFDVVPFTHALLGGPAFVPSEEAFAYTTFVDDPQLAIVRDGWKLIHHRRLGYQALYRLETDPFERADRALDEPARVRELGRRIGAHVARIRRSRPDF